ncbi:glucosamine-fructose-6-phosphate aminotransferase [Reticulomyxa filosa]|uniref:Glucosamine-fructose-6-phosphate aminotransferase n=1 Tax=Reticulomyxa filosa TaxID=46433 RepID=X6MVN4_RETFI|nr:glucosamine-fructose-6-phosphate aminotransferase [Reticulomyxa filosa]|eukprot:ETO17874.1 glucosamine-fructose-6-phosphate aminotransferase [Reticulomyxa filosa]
MEQPEAVSRTLGYGSRLSNDYRVKLGGLDKAEDMLLGIRHLVMAGCGTSYHAALYAQRMMQYLNSFETVSVEDAAEVTVDTFPSHSAGVLLISQSGETKDVLNALHTAEMLSIPRFSLVNAVGSAIARTTNCGVYMYAGREHGVASTKAFLTQVTGLGLIAGWFAQKRTQRQMGSSQDSQHTTLDIVDEQRRKELIEALLRLPLYCGVTLNTRDQCAKIAQKLVDKKHMFVLGKGFAEPIAYEGALKIKEITYLHAEGYSGGALKHGPFALIEEG